jgi:hypothetical protein
MHQTYSMIRSNNFIGCYEPPVENIEKLTNEKPIEPYLIKDCTFSTLENRNLRIKLALDAIEMNSREANAFINENRLIIPQQNIKSPPIIVTPHSCKDNSQY